MKKYHIFLSEIFPFLVVKFSIYLNRRVHVMNLAATDVAGRGIDIKDVSLVLNYYRRCAH